MTGRAIFIDDLIVNDTLGAVIVKPLIEGLNPECLGCGKCAEVCPVYLTPTEIKKALDYKDVDLIKQLNANKCVQCGLCSYICPSHVEITEAVVKAKELLRKGAK
jgi:electron transport complex protein RnfC